MARLEFTPDAVADIEDIASFSVDRFGRSVADEYLTGLESACQRVGDFPQRAPIVPRVRPEMRCQTYRRHRIFYQIMEQSVIIVRILHQARDVKRAL